MKVKVQVGLIKDYLEQTSENLKKEILKKKNHSENGAYCTAHHICRLETVICTRAMSSWLPKNFSSHSVDHKIMFHLIGYLYAAN